MRGGGCLFEGALIRRFTVYVVASCGTMSAEQEEVAINCVAIFDEEGKGGENLRKKNTFRCH